MILMKLLKNKCSNLKKWFINYLFVNKKTFLLKARDTDKLIFSFIINNWLIEILIFLEKIKIKSKKKFDNKLSLISLI